MDKATLRARMRAALSEMRPLVRAQEEELVNAAVLASPEWATAETVLLYKAKAPELSVVSLTNAAWRDGKRVLFPRVANPAGGILTLHPVADWSGLLTGAFGIDEPRPDAASATPLDVDLGIIPGLAFTRAGDRLGQGGGFYDRLLPQLAGPTFGVAFDSQVLGSLPLARHDRRVDRVWSPRDALT